MFYPAKKKDVGKRDAGGGESDEWMRTDGHAAGDDVRGMYLGRGRGKPRNARGRGWVGALPDRRMGQIVVGPQQMQNVTATGRKDGGAAMGKSGDDGDSAIVSDGERERPPHPPIRQRLLASTATTSYPPRDIYLPLYENKL